MTHAIRIHEYGGPEVLRWEEVAVGDPGPGELRIRHGAIGLNYIDVYHRTGLYPLPALPWTLGMEGAGRVEAVGPGVSEFKVGDRVAYASPPVGAYAEVRLMPADRVVALPDAIDERAAAAMLLQGMTAQYLLRRSYRVQAGDTILLHAALSLVEKTCNKKQLVPRPEKPYWDMPRSHTSLDLIFLQRFESMNGQKPLHSPTSNPQFPDSFYRPDLWKSTSRLRKKVLSPKISLKYPQLNYCSPMYL